MTTTGLVGVNLRSGEWGFADGTNDWVPAPVLPDGGKIVIDDAALHAAARDRGNQYEETPAAILRAEGAQDIAAVVAFAHRHGIPCAARGTGHMVGGQALVRGGIVIDMLGLRQIHALHPPTASQPGWIEVDAGALLWDIALAAYAYKLRVASGLPGRTKMTVGGVISALGWTPNIHSPFVSGAVTWMRVVTPEGAVQECTPESALFRKVLGGVGQHGIITRVRLALVPVKPRVRTWLLPYVDISAALRDLLQLADRGEMDELHIAWKAPADMYCLEAAMYFDPAEGEPDDDDLLRALRSPIDRRDRPYLTHVREFADVMYDAAEEHGWNELPKIFDDRMVSEAQAEQFIPAAVEEVDADLYSLTSVGLVAYKSAAALAGMPSPPLPDIPPGQGVLLLDFLLDFPGGARMAEAAAAFTRVQTLANGYGTRIRQYSIGWGVDPVLRAEGGLAPGARRDPIILPGAAL